jgi:hemolysin activation/secretion protein
MLGDVPFYELSRYEDTSAIGGSLGVRGVPGYSFYGKVKAFGNVELRTAITNFSALDRKFKFGVATFFDAGRIWSDLRNSRPDLDGTGLGLHYGIGAGIRLQQGRAFLVRADLAWSPDASPIAGYVLADHIF